MKHPFHQNERNVFIMTLRFITKNIICWVATLLLAAMILSAFAACTPAGTGEESSTPAASPDETPIETPVETPEETPEDSGSLGNPEIEYPTDPEKEEAPENPAKPLFSKSSEKYSGDKNIGCKKVTILSQYNVGLECDLTAYKDTTKKIFYLCLPSRADLSSVTFMVTHYNGTESGPYTADFSDNVVSDNEKTYGNTSVYTLIAMKSDRPSLMLLVDEEYGTIEDMNDSGSHSVYTYGDVVITMPESTARANGWTTRYESVESNPEMNCTMEMRGRGNATWGYPKKGYQFELETDADLLGLGSSDTFVILPNYNDASLMRNQVALWLGQELDAGFTSKFVQVDVFMNDDYLGMYMLTEKCDVGTNRIEIDKNEDFLYEVNQKYLEYDEYGFLSENDSLGKIRLHTKTDEAGLALAKEIFYTADNAAYSRNEEEFLKYFDLESWAKAYIIQQFTMNHDAYWGSFYFYYDNSDGKLHACTPWDFDYSMGISWASKDAKLRVENPNKFDISGNYLIEAMIKYDSFKKAVVDVYYNHGGEETIKKLPEMIDFWTEENRSGAEMNAMAAPVRWYPDTEYTDYTEDVETYDDAVIYLEYIINNRIGWFDNLMLGYLAEVGLDAGTLKGIGSKTDPYIIADPLDFVNMMLYVQDGDTFEGEYFKQTADIELPAFCPFLGNRFTFAGIYNGNGHSIKYKVNGTDGCLFPKVAGTVMNLSVEGELENTLFGAGLARSVANGGSIVNCIVDVDLLASSAAGITVNAQSGSKLYGCVYLGKVDKESATEGAMATSLKDADMKHNFSKPMNGINVGTSCTFENDMARIASELNASRAALAAAAGVDVSAICEARVENGTLVLVPVK